MHSTPLSFDHLASATDPRRERHAEHPIEAQIRRNGQMKYQRTQLASGSEEVVMPDGEVIVQAARPVDGRRPAD